MKPFTMIGGLAEIAEDYDLFLVDQFGVLHDGHSAYDGAIQVLQQLKAAEKKVVLLSNSGKRSAPNATRLQRLGFPEELYDLLVTSGEVAWHQLSAGGNAGAPQRCLLLSRDGDRSAVEGLDLELVDEGAQADIVLLSGSDGREVGFDTYVEKLKPAAERGISCLCTNPDKVMITPQGLDFGAGRIAEAYESLGGSVTWIGKPFPAMYHFALARCGSPPAERILGIGDSIEHDIAGAAGIGAATLLIKGGILAEADEAELSALFHKHGATPDYLLESFHWD